MYPVEFTCFSNFDWSLKHEAKLMNDWYEQWSKAGAGPDFRVEFFGHKSILILILFIEILSLLRNQVNIQSFSQKF